MSTSGRHDSEDRLERRASLLREPDRALPDSLRTRLLAIGTAADLAHEPSADDAEVDRLYAAALHAAETGAEPDLGGVAASGTRSTVVELLAAVIRDARAQRAVPHRLGSTLRTLGGGRRPLPRWIAEPRWAAAACWMLAFALTFGTGDAGALLLEAPSALQSTSQRWTDAASRALDGAGEQASEGLRSVYGLLRSRAVATASWTEAQTERLGQDLEQAWNALTASEQP